MEARALAAAIKRRALELGFDAVGITDLRPSEHAELYRAWLAAGWHGEMGYLARPDAVERRVAPGQAWPELRSAVVVAHGYGQEEGEGEGEGAGELEGTEGGGGWGEGGGVGVVARYARGRDYHRVVRGKLLELLKWLEGETGRELAGARAYVDTGPVLERELARRAGLGWFGRNTMLIHPRRGSYFFLGVLLLELELPIDEPFRADHCGSCRACLDACPTGALLGRNEAGAPVMDATRCISYLTIEQRGAVPRELRPALGNRIFGCDICQEVCPWNAPKLVQVTQERDYLPRVPGLRGADPGTGTHPHTDSGPSTDSPSLVALLRMTRDEWDRWARGSAIRRAGYAGLRRNVAAALGNWLTAIGGPPVEALDVLNAAVEDGEPLVREHAVWALKQARS